jgi:L-aspartate oxidase
MKYKIDITSDLIPVSPAAHYMIGGINTNLNGETMLNGLYSCGETAFTGVHGANRLASNSLLECLVFSYRAIEDSKKYLHKEIDIDDAAEEYSVNSEMNKTYLSLKNNIQRILNETAGIVRSKETLNRGLEELYNNIDRNRVYKENEYYSDRLKSLKTVAELIINGAIKREESRGCHIRADFPNEGKKSYNIHQSIKTGITKKEL